MRTIAKKIKQVLFHPSKYFSKNTDGYAEVLKYLLLITLVPAAIGAVLYYAAPDEELTWYYAQMGVELTPGLLLLLIFLDSITTFLLATLVMHLFVYIWGGRYGLLSTARAIAFSYTPLLLFGWIPYAYLFMLAWSLVLLVIGIREQHRVSTQHAVGALITPIVALILLFAISALVG